MMYITYDHWLIFGGFCVATWCLVLYLWPRLLLTVFKRAILVQGFGDGPIPINTLYTETPKLFAEPLAAQTAGSSNLAAVGVNHDTLLTVGWLDLAGGPQVLHVPDMGNRYYSVQFTDPAKNINFAYVGKRTTGTAAGDYFVSGPGWKGGVPQGMAPISSPNNAVLVIGRVLVESDDDLPTAYGLAKQIQLTPLNP
jgi:hypothetical protein